MLRLRGRLHGGAVATCTTQIQYRPFQSTIRPFVRFASPTAWQEIPFSRPVLNLETDCLWDHGAKRRRASEAGQLSQGRHGAERPVYRSMNITRSVCYCSGTPGILHVPQRGTVLVTMIWRVAAELA
jgi:hypothetical protein